MSEKSSLKTDYSYEKEHFCLAGHILVLYWQKQGKSVSTSTCRNGRKKMLKNIYYLIVVNKTGRFYVFWHDFSAYSAESPYLCSVKRKRKAKRGRINQQFNKG